MTPPERPAHQRGLRDPIHQPGEHRDQGPHQDRADQIPIGNELGSQLPQHQRTAHRLDDVVGGNDEEEVEKGEQDLSSFPGADLHKLF